VSHGKASTICRAVHTAVGCSVTLKCITRRRSWASTTKTNRIWKVAEGNGEEVDRDQVPEVILQKGSPGLRGWPLVARHVFGHCGLRNLDAQLEELAMNPGSAPERIGQTHSTHEGSDLRMEPGPSRAAESALPAPVVFEPLSVPADDRFGLDNHQRSFPASPSAAQ